MKHLLKISALILTLVCCAEAGESRAPNIILIMAALEKLVRQRGLMANTD